MSMQKQTNQRLFNKLFTEMRTVKKLKNPISEVNNIKLDKELQYVYYSKKDNIWFGFSETNRKYIYFFGKEELFLTKFNNMNSSLMIDFDKKNTINKDSLGLINSKLEIFLNKDILLNKYPTFDLIGFNEHILHHFVNGHKIEINVIELGKLDSDFISNLNQFIKRVPSTPKINRNKKIYTPPKRRNNMAQPNSKSKNNELITQYIKLINEGKTNKEAFEILDIPRFKVKNWKRQGQLGNNDYKEFYETYLFAVDREEKFKMKRFIDLVKEGKSNEEAQEIIRMPKFKINQWLNKGKEGDKDYVEFYKVYTKKEDTINSVKKTPNSTKSDITPKNDKVCEICGRSLPKKSKDKICKRCIRKQRCANIVQDILPSIDPGIPFKKDDLKKLGLSKMQLQDYIWTLQEFSLIKKEKNNKFSLIEREKLDEFIKESGVEIKEIGEGTIKLTKKCSICGETLEISKFPVSEDNPDGYEDTCKNCKKLVTTAGYLKELLQNFKYNEEFSENDLKKYYPDPFLLQAKIWSLQENDLLILNLETQKYTLADEAKCEKFLDKYFEKLPTKITKPIPEPPKVPETPTTPKTPKAPKTTTNPIKTKKQKQMDTVLNAMKEGKTRKEAAKIAGISLYKITHWYKEGRDGFGEDNVYFHKELKEIEKIQQNNLKKNMKIVLKVLKSGGNKSKAAQEASIKESDIDEWIKLGSKNKKPYNNFKRQYDKINKKSNDYTDSSNVRKRKLFLENIRNGETRKDSAKKANIDLKLLDSWIIKGTKGKEPYNEFYNEYKEAREVSKEQPVSDEKRIKQQFINLLKQGYSHGEASRKVEKGAYAVKIKKWYAAGKQGVKKHLKFYLKCQKAKNISEKNKNKFLILISDGVSIKEACKITNLDPIKIKEEILKGMDGIKPYDKFYIQIVESKTRNIDIRDRFTAHNDPNKDQIISFLNLLISGTSKNEALKTLNIEEKTFNYWMQRGKQEFGEIYIEFYKTYNQIISGELNNQFKTNIKKEIEQELSEIENKDADILQPLPKKIRMKFNNFISESLTGFAWVSKESNLWTYSLRKNRQNIKLTDNDLIELHKKVLKNNLIWGVLDLDKAKESLRINGNQNNEKNKREDILKPLPEDLKANFSKGTSTGFAWVSKSGKYYYYIRNNLDIKFKELSIENLHKRVIANDLEWGVLSIAKAKKTLEESSKVPISTTSVNTDILAPLPDDIEKELSKYSKGSKTGFAWVGKSGKKYSYERVVNGTFISIREPTIEELHKKVINQNLTWGVRDFEKAKKTLNEKIEEPTIEIKQVTEVPNSDIYALLPEEFEDSFKSTKMNRTGIAWVNKIGNYWIYNRRVNGETVEIKDENIKQLHKKVIAENLTWGVRDLTKAKRIISTNELIEENTVHKYFSDEKSQIAIKINDNIVSINGKIKTTEVLNVLTTINTFGNKILKLDTKQQNDNTILSIKLNLNDKQKLEFEEKIKELGWNMN